MSTADDLLAALNAVTFESALDGILGSLDKEGLTDLMKEMDAKSAGIPDQTKRHLFKNGITSVKMSIDAMWPVRSGAMTRRGA